MTLTERDLEYPDPLRLDREIARAAGELRRWRRRLRRGEGTLDDPFWAVRLVASRSAFRAIQTLPESDPLRPALLAWTYRLAEQRVDRLAIVRIAVERRHVEHVISEPERARCTLAAMLDRALSDPARRAGFLASFVGESEALGDAVATLWERRQEVAVRMGLGSPDEIESPGRGVVAAAEQWLGRTRDLLSEWKRDTLSGVLDTALAGGATEGWPRHLLPRTVLEPFRSTDLFRGLALDPGELPPLRAPASFLRALSRLGAAWADATAPSDQPFVIAHDPYGLRRRTMGALLGALPATLPFARRTMGVSAARAPDYVRSLALALLVESRAAALRVLLRPAALAGRKAFREAFEREVHRTFGVAVRPSAAGALWQIHADDPQRFAGLLLSAALSARLRDAHDEDWHRSPRAAEQLRDEARLSPERTTTSEALARGADALHELLARSIG